MRISRIPKAAYKIYAAPQRKHVKAWNRQIKLLDDKTLVKTLKAIIKSDEALSWNFASVVLIELHTRDWSKKNPDTLQKLKMTIEKMSKLCFSSRGYALEVAGIAKNSGSKNSRILHPYAFSDLAQKILYKWEASKTTKSLQNYIAKRIPHEDVAYLKNHTITYLAAKKLPKHKVTFEDGFIKIGDRIPKDGWYIFVLRDDELHAGIKISGKFHHTSFFKGAPVASAGELFIEDGKLQSALLLSGHYKPTPEHGEQLRAFLAQPKALGPEAAATFFIEPYDN